MTTILFVNPLAPSIRFNGNIVRTCETRIHTSHVRLSSRKIFNLRMCLSGGSSKEIDTGSDGSNIENDLSSGAVSQRNYQGPCTYCNDEKIVECPVCEGAGYHGRTIVCYYCHGKTSIACPLCIDDIYKASWQPSDKPESNKNDPGENIAEDS